MNPRDRLIVALDFDSAEKALAMANRLKNDVKFFKVGLELFSASGPSIISSIREKDCEIFLDLKLHDIPNTVAKAAVVAVRAGVYMFNVHALGGYDMMRTALETAEAEAVKLKVSRPKMIAVTILTSMDENSLKKIGLHDTMSSQVLRLARLAKEAGLDGVVASPAEAKLIREDIGPDFLIVTPGVRPAWAAVNDQKRIATPASTIKAGADFIVVGRPITDAKDPAEAAREVLKEMGS